VVETFEKFVEHHSAVGIAYKYEKRVKDPQERKRGVEMVWTAFSAANREQDAAGFLVCKKRFSANQEERL